MHHDEEKPKAISLKEIFELSEKLMGERAEIWLDRHNDYLGYAPSDLLISENGRNLVYDYLIKMQETASEISKEKRTRQFKK